MNTRKNYTSDSLLLKQYQTTTTVIVLVFNLLTIKAVEVDETMGRKTDNFRRATMARGYSACQSIESIELSCKMHCSLEYIKHIASVLT